MSWKASEKPVGSYLLVESFENAVRIRHRYIDKDILIKNAELPELIRALLDIQELIKEKQ